MTPDEVTVQATVFSRLHSSAGICGVTYEDAAQRLGNLGEKITTIVVGWFNGPNGHRLAAEHGVKCIVLPPEMLKDSGSWALIGDGCRVIWSDGA